MKVVAFNGSPRKGGNTEICLNLIGEELSRARLAISAWSAVTVIASKTMR